ncbi:MAG TPA: hypothetical protein VGP48_10585 [Stellaceae bacterium]|nr:hypothetical protein [Stellaceae bacterium]
MRFSTIVRTATLALALTAGAALSSAFADSVTNMSAPNANQSPMATNEQLALASDPAQVTSAQANLQYEMNVRRSPDASGSYDHGW